MISTITETTWRLQRIRQVLLASTTFDPWLSRLDGPCRLIPVACFALAREAGEGQVRDTTEAETTLRNAQNAGRRMTPRERKEEATNEITAATSASPFIKLAWDFVALVAEAGLRPDQYHVGFGARPDR